MKPEEVTFTNLPEWYELFWHCKRCGRDRQLDRQALASRFGRSKSIVALARRMRCRKYGNSEAAAVLDHLLAASRPARCAFVERDRYGRIVGVCFRADGIEVNRWLVANGFALDWARYTATVQEAARRRKLRIWQGDSLEPCRARAEHANHAPHAESVRLTRIAPHRSDQPDAKST